MPIYEYRCRDCQKRSSVFVLSYREQVEPICSHCGGKNLVRIMSRFATVRSEDAPSLGDVDEGAMEEGLADEPTGEDDAE